MKRVLIVDDNASNLYLLRALLQGHEFTVDEARHGAEALSAARQQAPDLVVSDLLMPVMDGYTLLRHWRADGQLGEIPFVVYTATYTEPRDERLAMALGADAFIIKPSEPDVLMGRIRDVLERGRRSTQASAPGNPMDEQVLLKEYNEVLVQKLEKKARQLEEANAELRAEIAERAQTEAALRASEERYRTLFQAITDPLFVYDRETLACLDVNEAAVALYGYTRDEFLTMTLNDVRLSEEATNGSAPEDHEARRGTWRHRKKNGSVFDVEISAYALDYAGRPACFVQARDVTQIRKAEAEAAQKSRLLNAVVEGTSDAVFVKDRDGKYLLFNKAAARAVGKPVEAVIGNDDTAVFGPDDAAVVMANDRAVMESNATQTFEEVLLSAGEQRVFLALKAPYRDEAGNVIGLVGVSRDITERRELEEQLRQAQKMEAVGRLAGGVAHDFNNLLTVISGHSDLMLSMEDMNESDRESISAIQEAGERAAALTRQLLGFSRQTILQPKVLELNALVEETGNMLRRLIGEDILFTTVLDPNLGRVKVDPNQLNQVLMNLAINARDAMPRGGSLTIETANVVLDETNETLLDCTPGPHVMLAMTDTGCGMSREVMARVFEPFFTTKPAGKGTGLGLAMVFGIVQQSGGCIHVYSEPGSGTTFRIYLPIVDEQVAVSANSASEMDLRGDETVLLVEDDAGVRDLALRCLERHGYKALAAVDGHDALRVVRDHTGPLDLVLTDVVMPNMGGPELAERLSALAPGVKVLFSSGYTDDAVVRHGLLQANVAFIQKPYTPLALARKVRQILDNHRPAGT